MAAVIVLEPFRVVIDGTAYSGGDRLEVNDAETADLIANGWVTRTK